MQATSQELLGKSGHFEGLELIHQGDISEVYRAICASTRERIIVKLLRSHETMHESVDSERTARRLFYKSDRIVVASGEMNIEGRMVFTYPQLKGCDLWYKTAGQPEKRMPQERALVMGIKILEALQPINDAGYAHADLTPTNIMVESRRRIRLIDMGLLIKMGKPVTNEPGYFKGVPGYVPTEFILGKGATRTSDLFAFGQVLNFMLTGRIQFEGNNPDQTFFNQWHKKMDFTRLRFHGAAPEIIQLIKDLLQKDPKARPTLRETKQYLKNVLKNMPNANTVMP